eukprot:CAMPEP_0196773066 /NCGR_PEP_ID=MMETSP1104-20130614/2567_1 /TAXON_ID=33652 /ORGANISM="Cafeteria sp., Strain Caron Lab Isolate" /LENGTH=78 /DNA_ID=CAMNT_0042143211 /DNA_START=272 /DNA_END=505 /DNA_ORIENTATION=+
MSFTDRHKISSTPILRSAGAWATKDGRWTVEHISVKAPGTPNITTVRPRANSSQLRTVRAPAAYVDEPGRPADALQRL